MTAVSIDHAMRPLRNAVQLFTHISSDALAAEPDMAGEYLYLVSQLRDSPLMLTALSTEAKRLKREAGNGKA